MTLIPFILDLAEELNEFNRSLVSSATGMMDVDDFGIYPLESQLSPPSLSSSSSLPQQHFSQHSPTLSPQQQRRSRLISPLFWVPGSLRQRHHPYQRGGKTACCNKSVLEVEKELAEKDAAAAAATSSTSSISTTSASSSNAASGANNSTPATAAAAAAKSAYSVVNKNGFQVSMNVKQFAPDELTVKTIDNCIVVEGQHDEKEDGHGVISRHFIRKYMLPKGYDPNQVLSTLSSDGILTVKAPPPPPPIAAKTAEERLERIVDIQQTGGPAQLPSSVKDAQTPQSKESPQQQQQQQQPVVTKPITTVSNVEEEKEEAQQKVADTTPTTTTTTVIAVATDDAPTNTDVQKTNVSIQEHNGKNGDESTEIAVVDKELSSTTTPKIIEADAAATTTTTTNGNDAVVAAEPLKNPEIESELMQVEDTPASNAVTIENTADDVAKTEITTVTVPAAAEKDVNVTNNGTKADIDIDAAVDGSTETVAALANEDVEMSDAATTIENATKTDADAEIPSLTVEPPAGEILAAADAAILLAKSHQQGNETNGAGAAVVTVEEVAN